MFSTVYDSGPTASLLPNSCLPHKSLSRMTSSRLSSVFPAYDFFVDYTPQGLLDNVVAYPSSFSSWFSYQYNFHLFPSSIPLFYSLGIIYYLCISTCSLRYYDPQLLEFVHLFYQLVIHHQLVVVSFVIFFVFTKFILRSTFFCNYKDLLSCNVCETHARWALHKISLAYLQTVQLYDVIVAYLWRFLLLWKTGQWISR